LPRPPEVAVKRKRLLLLVGIVLAAAVIVAAALEHHAYCQKLARGRFIDRDHCERIKDGMSQAEVEAILGGPPGDFSTNRGDRPLTFSLFDTIRPALKTTDGKALRVDGGRNATRRVEPLVVEPGKSEMVRWRARLESLRDGKSFRLGWTDGAGMLWYSDGVRPGKYLLRFEYDHSKNDKFWTGKATTNDVEIEVVAPEGAKRE
jgi:hypothetical protein